MEEMVGKLLHFDCFSGISGDMVLGALADVGVPEIAIKDAINTLGIPASVSFEKVRKSGFEATRAFVQVTPETKHRHLHHIEAIIDQGKLTDRQNQLAKKIFRRLAEAEARVHGMPIEKVHFHEVGAADSIVDIVGSAVGLCYLELDRVTSRSLPTGNGMIRCEHGMMPIPAPATALLLEGAPLSGLDIPKELTTPTGAAILTSIVNQWCPTPDMKLIKVGCGAGTMELPNQPNILRLFLGEMIQSCPNDVAWVLETNLDDISPEIIAFAMDALFQAGALDVYAIPLGMKKNRPGSLLGVICKQEDLPSIQSILFRETGTFGIRKHQVERVKLQREAILIDTQFGPVAAKRGWVQGHQIITPEYEDCARVARLHNIPLREVYLEVTSKLSK